MIDKLFDDGTLTPLDVMLKLNEVIEAINKLTEEL